MGSHRHPGDTTPLDLAALAADVDRRWSGWERSDRPWDRAPWGYLLGVISAPDSLVHRPLDSHPADALHGWSAPDTWCAAGVAVSGTARRHHTTTSAPLRSRVVWICHRDGRSVSLLRLGGQPPTVQVFGSEPAAAGQGRIPWLLRRSLEHRPSWDSPTLRPH